MLKKYGISLKKKQKKVNFKYLFNANIIIHKNIKNKIYITCKKKKKKVFQTAMK
jgi:hypothetical protein